MIHFVIGGIVTLFFIGLLVTCLPYAIGAAIIGGLIWLTYAYWKIAVPLWITFFALGMWMAKKEKDRIRAWKNEPSQPLWPGEVNNKIWSIICKSISEDRNKNNDYIFAIRDIEHSIPYGRANAFLNIFGKSLDNDDFREVFYFTVTPSKDRNELREYGTLIASDGIYVSFQKDERKDDIYETKDIFIPFAGLDSIDCGEKELKVKFITAENDDLQEAKLLKEETTLPLKSIASLCQFILDSDISRTLYHNNFISCEDEDSCINPEDRSEILDRQFNNSQNINLVEHVSYIAAIKTAGIEFNKNYAETKNLMDGQRGNGYGAEYGNNTFDRLTGKEVVNAAQQLDEHGRQVKCGADRIVNDQNIQTKYYKTASESVGACFEDKQAKYLNPDGSMMQIEVPRDQYAQAQVEMQKRIDSGQVPGAKPGDSPDPYLRKGAFTYNQSFNIAKAGTLESLSVDIVNGVISSTYACGISGAIIFATCIWNGKNPKEAAKISLQASLISMGKSVLLYTLTMQLSRGQFANLFRPHFTKDGIRAGFEGINNPIAKISNTLAEKISRSTLAKTCVGETMGLRTITGRAIISGTVIGIVTFGPDVVRALRGRISKQQLFKNTTVGATALVGASIGQALLPIPGLGAIAGAGVSGWIAKKTLDRFVEDDNVLMFQVFKEEFLDCAMQSRLSKSEFDTLITRTLCNNRMKDILTNMYASGEPRKYARALMNDAVSALFGEYKKIEEIEIVQGIEELSEETVAA